MNFCNHEGNPDKNLAANAEEQNPEPMQPYQTLNQSVINIQPSATTGSKQTADWKSLEPVAAPSMFIIPPYQSDHIDLCPQYWYRECQQCCFQTSDVFGEQKSVSGSGSGSTLRVRVGFRDQHFRDVPLGFPGFFKVKFRIS